MSLAKSDLRVARPIDQLAAVVKFYRDGGWRSSATFPSRHFNPYWDIQGKTFEDPDGYRVVLQNASWA